MRARVVVTVVIAVVVTCLSVALAVAMVRPGSPTSSTPLGAYPPVGVARTITTGLTSPWGLAFLPDGAALVSERDTGLIKRVSRKGGAAVTVGRVRGVAPLNEGGLLGLAVPPGPAPSFLFAYVTTSLDNRVVRIGWDGQRLGRQTPILTGIPRADHHDGGRLLVGSDSTLFVSTGDAGVPALAQDRGSLAGKVLRITFDGRPAPGNPFPGSPVFTLGHRNVQGLSLDSKGRAWASEFGESDVDELNLLRAGANYGWPVYEGAGNDPRYIDPVVQWSPTSTASPSGIAIVDDVAYVASLRGEVLWQVPLTGPSKGLPRGLALGDRGRLRTVATAPDGSLWLVTSNTDGRGSPRDRDDRILRLLVR